MDFRNCGWSEAPDCRAMPEKMLLPMTGYYTETCGYEKDNQEVANI